MSLSTFATGAGSFLLSSLLLHKLKVCRHIVCPQEISFLYQVLMGAYAAACAKVSAT